MVSIAIGICELCGFTKENFGFVNRDAYFCILLLDGVDY